jgi:hypothetical protein
MTSHNVHINFGDLEKPIDQQLREQGLKLDLSPLERIYVQRYINEDTRLRVRCIITEAESDKARKRIFQIIKKHAKPL